MRQVVVFLYGWVPKRLLAVALAAVVSATPCAMAQAADGASPQLLKERLESLQGILTRESIDLVKKMRQQCAAGKAPVATARSRSLGADTLADASDDCLTVLARVAREGELLGLYRDLLVTLSGTSGGYERLPAAIATTVMKTGSPRVEIGNQRAAVVTPALALDAGFTVAYQKGERAVAGMPALAALKPIAERCLGQNEPDLGLCYSTGYVYGARAVSGQPMAGL